METQLLESVTDYISKIPNKEYYQIQKFIDKQPVEEYINIRFTEKINDFVSSGIRDSELLDILLYRLNNNKNFIGNSIIKNLLTEANLYLKFLEEIDKSS